MATTENPNFEAFNFPKYEYTFEIKSLCAESQNILVEYTPQKENLTRITLNLPILANFSPANLEEYIGSFAPHAKWFGQEIIINHESTLIGANSNIITE